MPFLGGVQMNTCIKHLLLLVILFCINGCSQNPPTKHAATKQQCIRIATNTNFTSVDVRKVRHLPTSTICKHIFEGLTRYDTNRTIQNALAETIEVSRDQRTYTITLKPSTWTDGTPVTAYDFEYSWKSTLSPEFAAPNSYKLFAIKNAKAFYEKKCPEDDLGIKVLDSKTLQITLEKPLVYFREQLASPWFFPFPKQFAQSHGDELDPLQVPTNGPFRVVRWQPNEEYILEKNPTYWDAATVRLDMIVFSYVLDQAALQLFEQQQIDFIGFPFSALPIDALLSLKKEKKLNMGPHCGTKFLRLNTLQANLADKAMRTALSLACDRQGLTEHVLYKNFPPTTCFVPQDLALTTVQMPLSDECRAKELMHTLSAEPPDDKTKLRLMFIPAEENKHVAQLLQQNFLHTLGLDVALESVESKVYFSRLQSGQYDIALSQWFPAFYDPIAYLSIFTDKTNGSNNTGWENARYKELLERSDSSISYNERIQLLSEAQNILLDECPIIPLYHPGVFYLKSNQLHVSSMNMLDFRHAFLATS